MKIIPSSFPILREARVIDTTDPEELGRIQVKIYPELAEIPDADCPWAFPASGGIHGKSFGLPLKDQIITCFCWSRFWNEFSFLPFNITKPTEHLFAEWEKNQKPKITDMKDDPEEEHFIVDEYEDGFTVFHDTKNSQHGFLHPTGTFIVINKDGSVWVKSVKKYTFHNDEDDLFFEADSESGDLILKTKGSIDRKVDGDVTEKVNGNVTERVVGDVTKKVDGDYTLENTGKSGGITIKNAVGGIKIISNAGNISQDSKAGFFTLKNTITDLNKDVVDVLLTALTTNMPTTMGGPTQQIFNPTIFTKLIPALVKLKLFYGG
jgi:hypothetical protein